MTLSRILTEHSLECDLLVAGGGMTGVCCALAAARLGVRVILCQDRPVLGGNASSEVRMHIVGATGLSGGAPLALEAREGGLIEELRLDQAVRNPQRSPAMMDLLLYDKCRSEPKLTLLLNTSVTAARVDGRMITQVTAERPSTEDRFSIRAAMFADCTGDGRLGAEAGAAFRHGREGRDDHGESFAPLKGDTRTLGSSIMLQARRHSQPMPWTAPDWVRQFSEKDFCYRPFGKPGSDLGLEYGYWWLEWGGLLDTIKDNERIRDELMACALGIWDYIKNKSDIDATNWALEWIGFLPGKRESRRFVGQHILTQNDLFASVPFPDAIAYGGWPIDLHPPEGIDAPDQPPCVQHPLPWLYDIPLRACLAASLDNLFFAGRNLSATHVAFASTRVMATCAAVGQGVGTAAALALRAGVAPAGIPRHAALLHRIQQRLLRDDAYLVGVLNQDGQDMARRATVTASSCQRGGEPEQIISGQTRSVHGEGRSQPGASSTDLWTQTLAGLASADDTVSRESAAPCAPPDRAYRGQHRWMSDPRAGLPAWIELRWPTPIDVREISLIFDTGLHRLLTLSQADGYTQKMHWGAAQPETVRDYTLAAVTDRGDWRTLLSVTGNYQRRRVHSLATSIQTAALRLIVSATNGLDHARVVEVRVYGE